MECLRRHAGRSGGLLLFAVLACSGAGLQTPAAAPVTKERLLQTLDLLKGDAADVLIPQVQQRGVDFEMTPAVEKELRSAGASEKLLAAVKKSSRGGGAAQSQAPPAMGLPGTGPATLPGTGGPAPGAVSGAAQSAAAAGSEGGRALLVFYGTCPKGAIVMYNATVSANGQELAKLACDSYFYSVASPGPYSFCVNKKKCQTADVRAGGSYYFHVPAKMIGYGLDPVPVGMGDQAVQSLRPLEAKRIIARDLVSVDSASPPVAVLTPGGGGRKSGGQ